jgi:hypothetical protein
LTAKLVDGETGGRRGDIGMAHLRRRAEQNRNKISTVKGVNGLHFGPEKEFNKGNSYVGGEFGIKGSNIFFVGRCV